MVQLIVYVVQQLMYVGWHSMIDINIHEGVSCCLQLALTSPCRFAIRVHELGFGVSFRMESESTCMCTCIHICTHMVSRMSYMIEA
jgi:hypothetical protein